MRRIFFAAGLFFDMSSTFSDSPDGRIAAALGLVGQPLLQLGIGHVAAELTCGVQLYELLLDGRRSSRIRHCNSSQAGASVR